MSKQRRSSFRGKVSKDAQRQKRAASSYGYLTLPRGVNVFKEEPGSRVKFDILPYVVTDPKHPDRDQEQEIALVDSLWYKRPFRVHRNVGSSNESSVCLSSIGKKCPICEYRAELIKKGADKEETDALRPSLRNLYVVVPLESKKYDEVPHVWDISQFLFQNLLNEELEEDPNNEVFPDLKEGLTLQVRFTSKTIGKSQPFADADRIDFRERESQYDEKIMEVVPALDDMLKILTYDELHAKFFEMEGDDNDEDTSGETENQEQEDDHSSVVNSYRKPKGTTTPVKSPQRKSEEKEEEEESVKPTKAPTPTRRTRIDKPEVKKSDCPYRYVFGKDWDTKDECQECKVYDSCMEEFDKQQ